ncbi:MAG TPA: DNRLRE domain-containing protein [Candidatus Coatesbacteria bacterium]|nr:DNRLRE domain-containing protein [Candidatus Coatesbacteria bacterium]
MNRLFFACLVVLVAAAATEAAEWVTIEADADAYVRYYEEWESEPQYADDNYGGEPLMYVLYNFYQWGVDIEIAYMHFDFSGLGDYDGQYLIGAQLVLHAEHGGAGWQRFLAVAEAWDEMTITFNNQPSWGGQLALFEMYEGYNYVDLDVGPIAPWVDAPETAYGILIWDTEQVMENDPSAKIHTRETDFAPELWLTFSGPAVQEASWGEIKASFE